MRNPKVSLQGILIRRAGLVAVTVVGAMLVGCSGGEPPAGSERTDPANAPRGGDMLSTNIRAGERAKQQLGKVQDIRSKQVKEEEAFSKP